MSFPVTLDLTFRGTGGIPPRIEVFQSMLFIYKANKFLKLQNCKFTDLKFFLDLWSFCKCGSLRICDLWTIYSIFCDLRTQLLFADLKLPQIRKYIIFSLHTQQKLEAYQCVSGSETQIFFFVSLRICVLWTGTPRKFADLLLRNENKNLRIYNVWASKKICMPPLFI
jgi:hypothetical protein